jgi:hypothetical protein
MQINNLHILASGPELQADRFGYAIIGDIFKKRTILNKSLNIHILVTILKETLLSLWKN